MSNVNAGNAGAGKPYHGISAVSQGISANQMVQVPWTLRQRGGCSHGL